MWYLRNVYGPGAPFVLARLRTMVSLPVMASAMQQKANPRPVMPAPALKSGTAPSPVPVPLRSSEAHPVSMPPPTAAVRRTTFVDRRQKVHSILLDWERFL